MNNLVERNRLMAYLDETFIHRSRKHKTHLGEIQVRCSSSLDYYRG
jgi:hypothetical protein